MDGCLRNHWENFIPTQKANQAYDRTVKSDVRYRFSIDLASLKK